MTWNYRIIKFDTPEDAEETWLSIHEVYYDGDRPIYYTSNIAGIEGETLDELKKTYEMLAEAFDKPVLTEKDFDV